MNASKSITSGSRNSKVFRFFMVLTVSFILSGCAAAVVGGAAVVATDRRSAGTVIDDQTAEVRVSDHIYSADEFDGGDHVKVEVNGGVVLLIGEVTSEAKKVLATERAAAVPNVDRVVNELIVEKSASLGQRIDSTWLTTKVNTALLAKNPVPGFDPTRIKVITSRNSVYLMGVVSREEGEAVAEVVRNVGGVERVVKVFNYTD